MKTVLFFLALLCSQFTFSQSLKGIVYELGQNEPLPFANVSVHIDGELLVGTSTDFDGVFTFGKIPEGIIDVEVSYVGFETKTTTLVIEEAELVQMELFLSKSSICIDEVVITAAPLLSFDSCYVSCCGFSCFTQYSVVEKDSSDKELDQKEMTMKLFPNPSVGDHLQLEYVNRKNSEGTAELQVFTLFGKQVYSNSINVVEGVNRLTMSFVDDLSPGSYLVQVNFKGYLQTEILTLVR